MNTRMGNVTLGAMLVILMTASGGYADLNTGLVAYYPFNGNANDESGNSNHGTLQGDASVVWDGGGNGKAGGTVLSLDGNGDYVHVPDSATVLPTTKGTVATWFKTDPSMFRGWDGEYGLIAKMRYSSSPSDTEFEMRYSRYPTGDVLHCYLIDNTGWDRIRYSVSMADGVWHSLVLTWEAPVGEASYKMYLDGVAVGTYETVNCSHQGITEKSPPIPMYIGMRMHDSTQQWYWYFKGMMDEVRIYNRALEPSEIQQLAGGEPTPAEQIQEILSLAYNSKNAGTLVGVGSGNSAKSKLNAFTNQLEQAGNLIGAELFAEACLQLQDAYKKCDGQSPPADTVTGSAAVELAEKIENLMESLSCPPAPHIEFDDDFVDPWPDTYSLNGFWMKSGPWENNFITQDKRHYKTYLRQEHVSVSDGKLVLTVPANKYEGAEIRSVTQEFHYGRYEASIKVSAVPGVVNAFFMRSPDGNKNEIDIEFLSNESGERKVHFVLHPFYVWQPHDAEIDLGFNPSESFNRYAFVWSASSVDFFVNDEPKASMPVSLGFPVPSRPGQLLLSNWSAGIPEWGDGPPSSSTTMEVDWVSFTPQGD